jgi:ubiquinone/menaquinone biosynthesis C-methylase UbiE
LAEILYNEGMKSSTCEQLVQLNKQFYQTFGQAFSSTRQRIQTGQRRILESIPKIGNWLDLGCGNGNLAVEWARQKREGMYIGVDFSPVLLREAKEAVQKKTIPAGLEVHFSQVDLSDENWSVPWRQTILTGAMAFAVLHHIPGRDLRLRLLCQVNRLLPKGSEFLHSEWQFQNNPRILSRKQPWSKIGIENGEVDPGDALLDWRHALPGQTEQVGLRYVHLFSREELVALAELSGFEIVEEFESDGAGGKLSLYQRWQKK